MRKFIERILVKIASRFGFYIKKVQTWNAINITNDVETLVDVGVAHGTPELYESFNFKNLILIEPVSQYKNDIKKIVEKYDAHYRAVGLSSEKGEIEINVNKARPVRSSIYNRSSLTKTNDEYYRERITLETLDSVLESSGISGPYGIKIDTEGHELEVLKGASKTLKHANFVITETSVQKRFENSYKFDELVCFMSQQGFTIANILSSEPDGKGLVRYVDLLFVKE